jgi:hypothetical protein
MANFNNEDLTSPQVNNPSSLVELIKFLCTGNYSAGEVEKVIRQKPRETQYRLNALVFFDIATREKHGRTFVFTISEETRKALKGSIETHAVKQVLASRVKLWPTLSRLSERPDMARFEIWELLKSDSTKPIGSSTISRRISSLNKFLNWLHE